MTFQKTYKRFFTIRLKTLWYLYFTSQSPDFFLDSELMWHKFSLRANVYSHVMNLVNDREVKGE